MKNPIKEVPAVKHILGVQSTASVREFPLIMVKVINQRILEQLYPTRGELTDEPYTDLGPEWIAVGKLSNSDSILCRNEDNGEIRLCWDVRFCRTKQDIRNFEAFQEYRRTVHNSLPTIFTA